MYHFESSANLNTPKRIITVLFLMLASAFATASAQPSGQGSVELDIPYVESGGHKQQLDLYVPAAPGYATILFVHGGSMTSGDRKDEPTAKMCEVFQSLGIGCAAMSYRLGPENMWPAQPNDVAAAFAWLKTHIAERNGDPNRIFLFGHSSGCLLVSIVAADSQYLAGYGYRQDDVAGVIPLGCRLDDYVEVRDSPPKRYEASWVPQDRIGEFLESEVVFESIEQRNTVVPADHVTSSLPPTLVLLAEDERFFPPVLRDAAEFVGRALVQDADANLKILKDRRHMTAINMMVAPDDPAVIEVVNFIKAH